jgi:hypothetical protein
MSKSKKEIKKEEDLQITTMIDAHWRYVEDLLLTHNVPYDTTHLVGFHYRTAFRHGYKHGLEKVLK